MEPTPKTLPITVFAIAGYANAGKDTFAKALRHHLKPEIGEHGSTTVKMADELKEALDLALGYVGLPQVAFTEDRAIKEKMRPLMVEFGKYCRSQDKAIFAKLAAGVLQHNVGLGAKVIFVTDMRYINEYQVLDEVCGNNFWSFEPIFIERQGNGPANDEEGESIRELLNQAPQLARVSFADEDFGSMDVAAGAIVQSLSRK